MEELESVVVYSAELTKGETNRVIAQAFIKLNCVTV